VTRHSLRAPAVAGDLQGSGIFDEVDRRAGPLDPVYMPDAIGLESQTVVRNADR